MTHHLQDIYKSKMTHHLQDINKSKMTHHLQDINKFKMTHHLQDINKLKVYSSCSRTEFSKQRKTGFITKFGKHKIKQDFHFRYPGLVIGLKCSSALFTFYTKLTGIYCDYSSTVIVFSLKQLSSKLFLDPDK